MVFLRNLLLSFFFLVSISSQFLSAEAIDPSGSPLADFEDAVNILNESGEEITQEDLEGLRDLLSPPQNLDSLPPELNIFESPSLVMQNKVALYEFSDQLWLVIESYGRALSAAPMQRKYIAVELKGLNWNLLNQITSPDQTDARVRQLLTPRSALPEELSGRFPVRQQTFNFAPYLQSDRLGDGFEAFGNMADAFIETHVVPRMETYFAQEGIVFDGPIFQDAPSSTSFSGEYCDVNGSQVLIGSHGKGITTPYGWGSWFGKARCLLVFAGPAGMAAGLAIDIFFTAMDTLDALNEIENCKKEGGDLSSSSCCKLATDVVQIIVDAAIGVALNKWGGCLGSGASDILSGISNAISSRIAKEIRDNFCNEEEEEEEDDEDDCAGYPYYDGGSGC